MGVRGWRKVARSRGVWKLILKEAQAPACILEPVEKIDINNKIYNK
jgi:hypothetical protein